jgi:hypothetical protein
MKSILLACALLFLSAMAQANSSSGASNSPKSESNAVAERLASININEVVVIAMQLQLECQQLNSQDVCEGVKNILAVLNTRLSSLSETRDTSVSFVKGLMEGVNDANQAVIAQLNKGHRIK